MPKHLRPLQAVLMLAAWFPAHAVKSTPDNRFVRLFTGCGRTHASYQGTTLVTAINVEKTMGF
jgi:hypothetical protein